MPNPRLVFITRNMEWLPEIIYMTNVRDRIGFQCLLPVKCGNFVQDYIVVFMNAKREK